MIRSFVILSQHQLHVKKAFYTHALETIHHEQSEKSIRYIEKVISMEQERLKEQLWGKILLL